ncbi:MAG: single-stranded DNA-binding protein, partial [Gemmatimonas sp.]
GNSRREAIVSRSVNKVTLIGNLGNDPEVRTTAGGGKVATFSLATSRQWNSQTGEKQEKTEWHRCVAWNGRQGSGMGLADIVEKYCRKGERVYVEGSIEYGQYKDKEGQTRYTTDIKVRELMLLGGRGGDFDSDDSSSSARARTPARSAGKSSSESFDDFPTALQDQDDDLPF